MVARLGIIVLFASLWAVPATVRAHPMLDRAIASYEEANFKTALRTFDTAARNADLSVEELLELFEMRALVHHALGDEAAMRADLRRLSAVRPSYELGRLAPPPVRTAFEEVREASAGALGVELRIERKSFDGAPWMIAHVLRVPKGLVDHVTLQCSISNDSKTISHTSQGAHTKLKLPESGDHHGCAATARTRQGGVLFSATMTGSVPLQLTKSRNAFEMPEYKPHADAPKAKKKKWPWIVAVTAVAVGGGVAAGVLLSQRSKNSDPSAVGGVTVSW
ncbi:MAG: hypothetical protein JRJ24_08475 [Deltaproteobacteria bacterium]|nr:hypothetical protein [Deltaproteobacteria bacterium]